MSPERETLYTGLSHAAWGYFFLNFDVNFGTVSVIPRFVGFLLLLSAIGKLSGERRDLALLRPLGILLAGWSGLDWLLSWGGGDVGGHILFLDLLVSAARLYFEFQLLTDLAAIAETYQPEESDLDRRIRRHRTEDMVLVTLLSLLVFLPQAEWRDWLVLALAVLVCVVSLMIMWNLFQLRRCLREEAA